MEKIFCGIDIGGTKMAAGLVSAGGELLQTLETQEHASGKTEGDVMDLAANMVRRLCTDHGIEAADLGGVGVGMAGHMRGLAGIVLTTSNLTGFRNYPLRDELSSRLGVRVILDNDANCQGWAEYLYGAGKGKSDLVFITVSTGIGTGIVVNGRLLRGQSGTAGEFGHTIIEPSSDVQCTCGNYGCFMSHACTLNLPALVVKKSTRMHTRLPKGTSGDFRGVNGRHIGSFAAEGDPVAKAVVAECADYMGILLYNIFQVLNPPMIVLGGGLMNWGDAYFDRLKKRFHELAKNMLYDPIQIVPTAIGWESGILGAAALFQEKP